MNNFYQFLLFILFYLSVCHVQAQEGLKRYDVSFPAQNNPKLIMIKHDGKWGIADTSGEVLVPVKFDRIQSLRCKSFLVNLGNQYGLLDSLGVEVFPLTEYDFFRPVANSKESYIIVQLNSKCGIINSITGNEVLPVEYDRIKEICEHFAPVYKEKEGWGLVDARSGEEVVPRIYDGMGEVHDGLAYVSKNGKAGFINTKGEVVVPLIYDGIIGGRFENGVARVRVENADSRTRTGLINKEGKVLVPLIYSNIEPFNKIGLARATHESRRIGYVDTTGAIVIPVKYNHISEFYFFDKDKTDGIARAVIDQKWGFLDMNGAVVIPFKYDNISEPFFKDGKVLVTLNGNKFYINRFGDIVK